MKEFNLSDKTEWSYDGDGTETSYYKEEDVKEFIKRREARLRNQIRIHWAWLKEKNAKEVADFIVTIANEEVGDKLNEN